MADHSAIEWTDASWNPVVGCTKVSPGCTNCYAEKIAERFGGRGSFAIVRHSEDKLDLPLRWRRPRRVFVNSMSDLFHDAVPTPFIARVFAVMARTPHHTYQLLTKRHGRMRSLLTSADFTTLVRRAAGDTEVVWPLPNLWLGVSVEDQQRADLRIPVLLSTPATVRWLSCEPLLGPIDLHRAITPLGDPRGHGLTATWVHTAGCCRRLHGLDWVVAGGESGPGARPMHPDWARTLRDQCQHADVAFFFKQWGAHAPEDQHTWTETDGTPRGPITVLAADASTWTGMPLAAPTGAVRMRRVGKHRAGRVLDGRIHDTYPPSTQRWAA
jgi:protein gp37